RWSVLFGRPRHSPAAAGADLRTANSPNTPKIKVCRCLRTWCRRSPPGSFGGSEECLSALQSGLLSQYFCTWSFLIATTGPPQPSCSFSLALAQPLEGLGLSQHTDPAPKPIVQW